MSVIIVMSYVTGCSQFVLKTDLISQSAEPTPRTQGSFIISLLPFELSTMMGFGKVFPFLRKHEIIYAGSQVYTNYMLQ